MTFGASSVGAPVPHFQPGEKAHRLAISNWSIQVQQGKIPVVANVTLAANTVNTVVSDARVGLNSYVGLSPTTAKGASAQATCWISAFGKQTFTITHSSTGATTKSFRYCVLG